MTKTKFAPIIVALQKSLQAFMGLITALIAVKFLSLEMQGYYYAIGSLLSSYVILDLCLSSYILQKAAALASKKEISNGAQFKAFQYWSHRLYRATGIAAIVLIYPFGYAILENQHAINANVNWLIPWTLSSLLLGLLIPALGFVTVIEGTGAIAEAYSLKIASNILGAMLTCSAIILGYGLYAQAMPFLALTILLFIWKKIKYKENLCKLEDNSSLYKIYNNEILERLGSSISRSLGSYAYLNVPIIISIITGSLENTGRLGLSIVIANIGGAIAMSLITAKIPLLIQSIKKDSFHKNKKIIIKYFLISNLIFIMGFLILIILTIKFENLLIFKRILNTKDLTILFLAFVLFININPLQTLLEASNIKSKAFELSIFFITFILIIIKYILNIEISENILVISMAIASFTAFIITMFSFRLIKS